MTDITGTVNSIEAALDIAIRLEQQGRDFYLRKREETDDPALRDILSFLAAEEEKHLGIYRNLLDTVNRPGEFQQFDLPGEYGLYIDMLVSEIAQWLREEPPESADRIIQTALNLEKNTLLFYQELRLLFTGKEAELIDKICREEKKHIMTISSYMKERLLKY